MKRLSQGLRYLWIVLLASCAVSAADVPRPWQPLTPQELQTKEVPGAPGAEAIQLYYSDEINDVEHDEYLYSRIKVLTEKGKRWADVEIPVFPGTSIHEIEARTIHPDGSIVPITDSSFERTLIRGRGLNIKARILAFPEVTVGSIIEYKYRVHRDDKKFIDQVWYVQHDLYTVKEHFWFRYDKRARRGVAWKVTPGFEGAPAEHEKGILEMDAANVPAFEPEELMPPPENYKYQVKFFYGGYEVSSANSYWAEYGGLLAQFFQAYIGNSKDVKKATEEVVGSETDPERKLRKIYARVQQIENLSFEHKRTEQETKKENLKTNKSIEDVLKHGYGSSIEITALFAGMARDAGADASLVMVAGRARKIFDKGVLSVDQMDSALAKVNTAHGTIYLDPGTRFCPFATVRWHHAATTGMDMSRSGFLVDVPGYPYDTATTVRTGQFTLTQEGDLKGTITLSFTGGEALEHRLAALDTDEAGRNKELEQELKARLPKESMVKLTDSKAWTNEDEPLYAAFSVEIPAFASAVGKRLVVPAALLDSERKTRLPAATRKFPIYFPYAFAETDKITINVPGGYTTESLPEARVTKLNWAKYSNSSVMNGGKLVMDRNVQLNVIMFGAYHYAELKSFYADINTGDEAQIVFRPAPAEAQKAP